MTIEVETGPMFSGKTTELIRLVKRLEWGHKEQNTDFLVFNHYNDKRYGENVLGTHDGPKVPAIALKNSHEIMEILTEKVGEEFHIKPEFLNLTALFIDEAQFFDDDLPRVIDFLDRLYLRTRNDQLSIYIAGLDKDFRGEPYGCMPRIEAYAHKVNKFKGICSVCGEDSDYTQRLVNGDVPSFDDPVDVVGAQELYQSRCRSHHEIKNSPQP
ncbi:MAG TPA: thymidine kinase [Spirochaetia bacterium]|nr:thymidine kinase [Spirochaetia bacterium]